MSDGVHPDLLAGLSRISGRGWCWRSPRGYGGVWSVLLRGRGRRPSLPLVVPAQVMASGLWVCSHMHIRTHAYTHARAGVYLASLLKPCFRVGCFTHTREDDAHHGSEHRPLLFCHPSAYGGGGTGGENHADQRARTRGGDHRRAVVQLPQVQVRRGVFLSN